MYLLTLNDTEGLKARWKVRERFEYKQEIELHVSGWKIEELQT